MYAPPVSFNCTFSQSSEILFSFRAAQVIQQRDSYKSSSIGSGPQFYTKPPTSLPINQTIEFDEGPKITVFVGKFALLDLLAHSDLNSLLCRQHK